MSPQADTNRVAHPLDPLTAQEIALAAAIIQAHFPWGNDLRVETIDIEERDKHLVRGHVPGTPFPRIACFNVYRRGVMGVWQGRADLERGTVISKTFRPEARAMVAVEEVLLIEKTSPRDSGARNALSTSRLRSLSPVVATDAVGDSCGSSIR